MGGRRACCWGAVPAAPHSAALQLSLQHAQWTALRALRQPPVQRAGRAARMPLRPGLLRGPVATTPPLQALRAGCGPLWEWWLALQWWLQWWRATSTRRGEGRGRLLRNAFPSIVEHSFPCLPARMAPQKTGNRAALSLSIVSPFCLQGWLHTNRDRGRLIPLAGEALRMAAIRF